MSSDKLLPILFVLLCLMIVAFAFLTGRSQISVSSVVDRFTRSTSTRQANNQTNLNSSFGIRAPTRETAIDDAPIATETAEPTRVSVVEVAPTHTATVVPPAATAAVVPAAPTEAVPSEAAEGTEAAAPLCQNGMTYSVQSGDTLSGLALNFGYTIPDYRAIVHYTNQCTEEPHNLTFIEDPNLIYVDDRLYIPTVPEIEQFWTKKNLPVCEVSPNVESAISIAGSSTVFPLTERMAELFVSSGYQGDFTIDSIGTGAGFERFCRGEEHLVNASRPPKQSEIDLCRANGRELVPFQIGTDAVVVAVNNQNSAVQDVSQSNLQSVFSTAQNWSDVNSNWSRTAIRRYIPGTKSGTFDVVAGQVFPDRSADEAANMLLGAQNLTTSEDDELLALAIERDADAIGFFGYYYYKQFEDQLRALAIDGISPTQEAVDTGTYPLLRPLFIYTSEDLLRDQVIQEFVGCYLANVKNEINQVGYFLPDELSFSESITQFDSFASQ